MPHRAALAVVLLAAVLLAIAACAGDTPRSIASYAVGYNPGEELYAGNDVPVVVRGNPFTVPQAEFEQAVVGAMQGWAARPDHFVLASDPNAVYRVVLMFDPPATLNVGALCRRPLAAVPTFGLPPAPRVPLSSDLCRGDGYMADAFGSIGTQGGPHGEVFRRGIGQFVSALFPLQNPEARPDRCRLPFC